MSNQHTGAPVLKGGLLQRYQLQARACGSALRPRPGPVLLSAAPARQRGASRASAALCAGAAGGGGSGGEE